jgi:hypothetical protein
MKYLIVFLVLIIGIYLFSFTPFSKNINKENGVVGINSIPKKMKNENGEGVAVTLQPSLEKVGTQNENGEGVAVTPQASL